jgi:hypothetical protein
MTSHREAVQLNVAPRCGAVINLDSLPRVRSATLGFGVERLRRKRK